MFIWSALQHYVSLNFRQLLWMSFDVEKLSQKSLEGSIPQNKLSQLSQVYHLAAFSMWQTSFTPSSSLFSRITYFEEPILKLTPLNALWNKKKSHFFSSNQYLHSFTLDFFLPSIDSRLIRFKSSMVTLLADSQSILSCSNAAFFTCTEFTTSSHY